MDVDMTSKGRNVYIDLDVGNGKAERQVMTKLAARQLLKGLAEMERAGMLDEQRDERTLP